MDAIEIIYTKQNILSNIKKNYRGRLSKKKIKNENNLIYVIGLNENIATKSYQAQVIEGKNYFQFR
jgi:hypothetical protein